MSCIYINVDVQDCDQNIDCGKYFLNHKPFGSKSILNIDLECHVTARTQYLQMLTVCAYF